MRPMPILEVVLWLYDHALRLYPLAFHEMFADEMRADFRRSLREAPGPGAVIALLVREARQRRP